MAPTDGGDRQRPRSPGSRAPRRDAASGAGRPNDRDAGAGRGKAGGGAPRGRASGAGSSGRGGAVHGGDARGGDPRRDRPRGGGDGRPGEDHRGGPRLAPRRPRLPEPRIADGVTGKELDRDVRTQLRTLSVENANGVAQHLVMTAMLLADDDVVSALAHAETAVRRAGRVPAAREALGMVAYRMGDFARALTEFRTVRRLSGSSHLLPLMVDCERGLGRADRALDLAASPEASSLDEGERAELAIVVSGIRRDLGQGEAALVALQQPALRRKRLTLVGARLAYAYADALLEMGRGAEARQWFARAAEADTELTTDAAERLEELDGVVVADLLAGEDAADGETDNGATGRDGEHPDHVDGR